MEFILIGIVSALNLIIIIHKLKKSRVEDAVFDAILMFTMMGISNGSYGAMVVSMIASLVISIYLWASPPMFFRTFAKRKDVKKAISDLKSLTEENTPKKKTLEDIKFD